MNDERVYVARINQSGMPVVESATVTRRTERHLFIDRELAFRCRKRIERHEAHDSALDALIALSKERKEFVAAMRRNAEVAQKHYEAVQAAISEELNKP